MARDWFERFEGAGLDGVVAKPAELTYPEGKRVMLKVKHERTADCVVGGFRWHKDGRRGRLAAPRPVRRGRGAPPRRGGVRLRGGAAARGSSTTSRRTGWTTSTATPGRRWMGDADDARASPAHRADGTRARTSPGRRCVPSSCARSVTTTCRATGSAMPPRFVAGGRTDNPASCTYAQLETAVPDELARVFGAGLEPRGSESGRAPPSGRRARRREGGGTCRRSRGVGPRQRSSSTLAEQRAVDPERGQEPEQLGQLALGGEPGGELRGAPHGPADVRVPVGDVVGNGVDMAVVGEHGRGRLARPSPARPGKPSALSPTRASQSGIDAGATP